MSTSTIPNRFSGATVVVTGAGSGIGKATATRLLAEGARVIASDLDADRLAALVAESGDAPLLTIEGDVSDDAVIASIVEAGEGRITGLVNNAGIMDSFVPTAEIDDALWERVMRINVTAPMKLMRAVLPAMVEAGHGRIVNVASEASIRAGASGTPYATSKHAVVGLTKSTALFYGPAGVRVNAVAPGPSRPTSRRRSAPSSAPSGSDRSCRRPCPPLRPPSSSRPRSRGCSRRTRRT